MPESEGRSGDGTRTVKMADDFWRYRVTRENLATGETDSVLYKVRPGRLSTPIVAAAARCRLSL
eukprot:SAG22_NODE_18081_length_293_cov_2.190722_1_plen_63_part_10